VRSGTRQSSYVVGRGRASVLLPAILFSLALSSPAQGQPIHSIEKIFYGFGRTDDPSTGSSQLFAFTNLTHGYVESHPGGGTFETFSQIFVLFLIPAGATGPPNGTGLEIRFSYYVDARCIELSESSCPLGSNTTAISQDVMALEVRRVIEYLDANSDGTYDPGDLVVREFPLSQPLSSFVQLSSFSENGSALTLPFNWNVSDGGTSITQGALFAGDPLLDQVFSFRVMVGTGDPLNLTLSSFLFLRPTSYKGIPLTPTKLKLDIEMRDIRYLRNDTALAIELTLESAQYQLRSNGTAASESVSASSAAAEAFFTWSTNATVDGRAAPIGWTISRTSDTATSVVLSYPRGDQINHDPILGLEQKSVLGSPPGTGDQGGTTLWLLSLGFAVGAVASATVYVLQRRARKSQ